MYKEKTTDDRLDFTINQIFIPKVKMLVSDLDNNNGTEDDFKNRIQFMRGMALAIDLIEHTKFDASSYLVNSLAGLEEFVEE